MPTRLFHSGPSIDLMHEEYAKRGRVYREAPILSSSETHIAAPVERVWEIMHDLATWPAWAPDISEVRLEGSVAVDERFTWTLKGFRIRSRFAVVDPGREITWTGKSMGAKAIDRHVLEPTEDGGTRALVEESLAGPLIPLFFSSAKLRAQHEGWLRALKTAAERDTTVPRPGA